MILSLSVFRKIVSIIFILTIALNAFGQNKEIDSGSIPWFDASLVLLILPSDIHRGAVFYRYPIIFPGISLRFFNDLIYIEGPGIRSKYVFSKYFSLYGGFKLVNDDAWFGIAGNQLALRKSRDSSFEFDFGMTFTPFFLLDLDFSFHQDLIAHKGQYFESGFRFKTFRILSEKGRPIMFCSTFFRFGLGSLKHNLFLYGPEAVSGINNLKTGLSFVFPNVLKRTTFITSIYYTGIPGENRNASLVRDRPDSVGGIFIISYKLPF